jgi:T4 RnlA family RNA ligase
MKFYLKTKEECDKIVENCESFLRADRVVMGYNVAIYDYRLASTTDFEEFESWELRGLAFVENPETKVWERNLLLNKFMNINQTKGETISWMYEDIKDKKIVSVQDKLDGSIISFVKFPNGEIRAKSKTSFESEQAKMAQEILDKKPILKEEVEYLLDKDMVPIFELVSPMNQIVLEYNETKLVLLQIRRPDGTYIQPKELKDYDISMRVSTAEIYDESWNNIDKLLKEKEENQEDIEGWIVTFEDGQMAKVKTDKYIQLHGLIGPDAFRENLLIQTILDGNMDDVIAQLVPGEKKDKMVEMDKKVVHKFNHLVTEFKELRRKYFNEFNENRKEFALEYRNHELFGAVMKTLNNSFRDVNQIAEDQVRDYVNRKTNSLGKAKEWIEEI